MRQEMRLLEAGGNHVRTYDEMLSAVKMLHREFLDRYAELRKALARA